MFYKLDRLGKMRVFLDNLRWDLTPEIIFKPRFIKPGEKCETAAETQGFMFYIDYMEDIKPALMILKTYELRSKTIGAVEDVPEELLTNAVKREGVKDITGMYPIDEKLEAWLKKAMGL